MSFTHFRPCTAEFYSEMHELIPPAVETEYGFLVGELGDYDEDGKPVYTAFVRYGGGFYKSDALMSVDDFKVLTPVYFSSLIIG